MNTYSSFTELARANGITNVASTIGLNVTFSTLLNDVKPDGEAAKNETTENIAKLNTHKDDISEDLTLWNMSRAVNLHGMRGCRRGLGLYIGSNDHGNPHLDAMQGNTKLAKIFIYPEVTLDPATPNRLSRTELDTAINSINKNLTAIRQQWNEEQKHSTASQKPPVPEQQVPTPQVPNAQNG